VTSFNRTTTTTSIPPLLLLVQAYDSSFLFPLQWTIEIFLLDDDEMVQEYFDSASLLFQLFGELLKTLPMRKMRGGGGTWDGRLVREGLSYYYWFRV